MTTYVQSAAQKGFDGIIVDVECDIANGLPSINIVGLGDKAVAEAKERVRSAITNSDLKMPTRRLTLNLAPADVPKQGSYLDLALAVAILCASGQLPKDFPKDTLIAGELSLDGSLRPVKGIINLAQTAKANTIKRIIIPRANAEQASLVNNITIIPVSNLKDVYMHANNQIPIKPYKSNSAKNNPSAHQVSMSDVKEQPQAKRALEIAAAGGHNVLLTGPPGTGKSMLAKAFASILPPLSVSEMLDVTKIHSIAGLDVKDIVRCRPFRSPHHTSSTTSIIGGGVNPKPGEVSLAHKGVLFLDELPEYSRGALESLRQPLEDRKVHISRIQETTTYPADFILIATKNPCPCGYYGDQNHICTCTPYQIQQYQDKISGPLLDRIDIVVQVDRINNRRLIDNSRGQDLSVEVRNQIKSAREIQYNRYNSYNITNSTMTSREISGHMNIDGAATQLLDAASTKLNLSARAYLSTLRVARTIADLVSQPAVTSEHISEALSYRSRP